MLERVKTAVLLVLLAVMPLLVYASFTLGMPDAQLGAPSQESTEPSAINTPAASPIKIALRTPNGTYMPEAAVREEVLQQIERICGEALGSAGARTELTEEAYLALLRAPSVLLAYDTELPFSLLRAWAGYEYAGIDATVRRFVLAEDAGAVVIAFWDEATRTYACLKTAADADRLVRLCAGEYESNAVFGFENSVLSGLAPDEPILLAAQKLPELSVALPAFVTAGELPRELLEGFSLNPYLSKVYPESDGTLVYIEDYNALRMTPAGELRYRVSTGRGIELLPPGEQSAQLTETVEKARALAVSLWNLSGASGTLSLAQIKNGENGALELSFSASYNGFPICDRSAAYLIVRDGAVDYLDLLPRVLTEGANMTLLPGLQLAAALPQQGDARPAVRYLQIRDGVLTPVYGTVK